jgi:hypothetical protein
MAMKGKTTPLTTIFEKGAVNHRPSVRMLYMALRSQSSAYFGKVHQAACHGGARLGPGLVAAHSLRSEELATLKVTNIRLWRLENTGGD